MVKQCKFWGQSLNEGHQNKFIVKLGDGEGGRVKGPYGHLQQSTTVVHCNLQSGANTSCTQALTAMSSIVCTSPISTFYMVFEIPSLSIGCQRSRGRFTKNAHLSTMLECCCLSR